jgi:histidine triad (HIT) family protein
MTDCIFCKIAAGEIPATRVYEDDECVVFRDLSPQAPVHVLVIPRAHLTGADALTPEHQGLAGHLLWVAAEVARREGLADRGYRLVINQGREGGQTVDHLHIHVIGGRAMAWPPG